MRRRYLPIILLVVSVFVVITGGHTVGKRDDASISPGPASANELHTRPAEVCSTTVTTEQLEMEQRVFSAINQKRRQNGVNELAWSDALASLAREHSCRMLRLGFAGHNDPERGDVRQRLDQAGIVWRSYAENIAEGVGDCASTTLTEWSDPGHLRNLLNGDFSQTGIGVITGPNDKCLLTAIFISTLVMAEAPQPPTEATECRLIPDRDAVLPGDPVELTWKINGPFTKAKLTDSKPVDRTVFAQPNKDEGSVTVKPQKDTTYLLTVTRNDGKEFSCRAEVKLSRCFLTADRERTNKPGDEVTLRWQTGGADIKEVMLRTKPTDGIGSEKAVAATGSIKVKPEKQTRYSLIVKDSEGKPTACTVDIQVGPPPECMLETDPAKAKANKITLKWTSKNSDKGELTVWRTGQYVEVRPFKFTATGELEVPAPNAANYYRLAVTSPAGETVQCTVKLEGGCALKVEPHKVTKPGEPVTLQWNAAGSTKRNLQPDVGEVETAGTKVVRPDKSAIYTLKTTPSVRTCSVCVTVPGSGVKGDGSKTLNISPVLQQTPLWCWLAVSEMVFRFYGVKQLNQASYQCGIVGTVFPKWCGANCLNCIVGAGTAGNITKTLRDYPVEAKAAAIKSSLREGKGMGQQAVSTGSLTDQEVKNEIDADRPIIAGITPGAAVPPNVSPQHVALIVGYIESDGQLHLIVNDPYPFDETKQPNPYVLAGGQNNKDGSYCIPYKAFRDQLKWHVTFYQIAR